MSIKILDSFIETGPKTRFIDDEGRPIYACIYYPVIKTETGTFVYKGGFEWVADAQDVLYHLIDEGVVNLTDWNVCETETEKKLTFKLVSSNIKKSAVLADVN